MVAAMTLEPAILSILVLVGLVLVLLLGVWVASLQRSEVRLRSRLRRLLADGERDGLDEVLDRVLARVEGLGVRVEALNALHHELAALTERSIQRVGIVRFNPFADTGGDQSFALTLLDARGTGIVISSLHSRADTRIFIKAVSGGRSVHALSAEEQDAIRQALAQRA